MYTQAKCVTADSSNIENKTRGECSDLAPLRIGLSYRARKNSSNSLVIWLAAGSSKKFYIFIFKIS